MSEPPSDWELRIARIWGTTGERSVDELVAAIGLLAAERPAADAAALFERASACDFAGREAEAEPLYRGAIAAGLDERRRPRAAIQLASTLRILGRAEEGIELLRGEIDANPGDGLEDARSAFLALALVDAGHAQEAVSVGLGALARHLPAYRAAVSYYSAELLTRSA